MCLEKKIHLRGFFGYGDKGIGLSLSLTVICSNQNKFAKAYFFLIYNNWYLGQQQLATMMFCFVQIIIPYIFFLWQIHQLCYFQTLAFTVTRNEKVFLTKKHSACLKYNSLVSWLWKFEKLLRACSINFNLITLKALHQHTLSATLAFNLELCHTVDQPWLHRVC